MHNIKYMLLAAVLMLAVVQKMAAQSSPNCATASDNDYYKSTSFFNYGNVSNAYTTKTRLNVTVGQPVVGSYFAQQTKGTFGFWSSFLMPPAAPVVIASEGDAEGGEGWAVCMAPGGEWLAVSRRQAAAVREAIVAAGQ